MAGFTGSLLAGLVYGFGPFLLGLARFHPASSLLAAGVPWLFAPAAVLERKQGKWLCLPLWLLPFGVIALFFYLSAGRRLFAAPLQANVRPLDLMGCIAPLALIDRSPAVLGVYHVPIAALVLGLAMVWKARRYGILLIAAAGLVLALGRSFLDSGSVAWLGVSPILWLSIPMLWCAILCGIGLEGLIEAGPADRRWVLAAAIFLGILAIVALVLAAGGFQVFPDLRDGDGRLFLQAGEIYLVGAGATGLIYLLTRQNLRLHWLRWAILSPPLAWTSSSVRRTLPIRLSEVSALTCSFCTASISRRISTAERFSRLRAQATFPKRSTCAGTVRKCSGLPHEGWRRPQTGIMPGREPVQPHRFGLIVFGCLARR